MRTIFSDSAWFRVNDNFYRHYSGVTVVRRGRLWTATTKAGASAPNQTTAIDAVISLGSAFNSYWTLAQLSSYAVEYRNVMHSIGPAEKELVFTFSVPNGTEVPEFMERIFRRHFYERAKCAACSSSMNDPQTHIVYEFDGILRNESAYISCECGYPVWRMETLLYHSARKALDRSRLIAAEGSHSASEIEDILILQGRRCIYCNAEFTNELRPEKDHILPLRRHGTNWALNIVLACKSCNSSRGDIPFRTFCMLLSKAQNKRILRHLKKRLSGLWVDQRSTKDLDPLIEALRAHDPKHLRYLDIQKIRIVARRNAKLNTLLPATIEEIMK